MADVTKVFEIPEDLWDAMLKLPDDTRYEARFNVPNDGDYSLTIKDSAETVNSDMTRCNQNLRA